MTQYLFVVFGVSGLQLKSALSTSKNGMCHAVEILFVGLSLYGNKNYLN